MEQCNGNAVHAAKSLGWTSTKAWNLLHKNPFLRARWTRSKENLKDPEQLAVSLYRPVDPVPASEMEAAEKADEQVKAGFAALGLQGTALDTALAIQKAAGRQIKSWMELMAGGVVKQFLEIENDIEAISAELCGDKLTEDREKILRSDRQALIDLRLRLYDRAVKAQVNLALVKLKMRGGEKPAKGTQPGFTPLESHARPDTEGA